MLDWASYISIFRIFHHFSVVFAGFSANALAERILDANSQLIITTDFGLRGGRRITTKDTVDAALKLLPPNLVKVSAIGFIFYL